MEDQTRSIKIELILAGAVILIAAAALIFIISGGNKIIWPDSEQIDPVTTDEMEYEARHPLTGEPVAEEMELPRVYAVMVENMVEAWPLSGIDQAFLIIEAPVEAAIPRLVAFYSEEVEVEKIGPVRSARPYYLDWSKEMDALYAHVGGSPEALGLIAQNGILDLNEFYNGWYFWRDQNRYAPHNVYTSSELLGDAMADFEEKREVDEPDYEKWQFKDDAVDLPETAPRVNMNFSPAYGSLYEAGWEYSPENNDYIRYQYGRIQKTREGDELRSNNIAIIETDVVVTDSVGRRRVTTVGEGSALVLQDGQIIEAEWVKGAVEDRLHFVEKETGEEIAFNAGVTWIEVLPSLEKVEIEGEVVSEEDDAEESTEETDSVI